MKRFPSKNIGAKQNDISIDMKMSSIYEKNVTTAGNQATILSFMFIILVHLILSMYALWISFIIFGFVVCIGIISFGLIVLSIRFSWCGW